MKSLTVVMTTCREHAEFAWFIDSLRPQINSWEHVEAIIVSANPLEREGVQSGAGLPVQVVRPKPNVWQGAHRMTTQDWWAKSNALNTALCLCKTDWISFVDDRAVLLPPWLQSVREAMDGNYAVCGTYEKRTGMVVEGGVIRHGGIVTGRDNRDRGQVGPQIANGGYWYGCTNALPLEWMLLINGFPEKCDSVSFEDIITGTLLHNNRFPIKFDTRMKIVEDRSLDKMGTVFKRSSKEKHPNDVNDKTHAILNWARGAKRSDNAFEIRQLRDSALKGEPWPAPDPAVDWRDWFDGQRVREM